MSTSRAIRSPDRVLQYIDHVRECRSIGQGLGLLPVRGGAGEGEVASRLELLRRHHRGQVSTREVVRLLADGSSAGDVTRSLLRSLGRPKVEFHPVQGCNFRCGHCSWIGADGAAAEPRARFPVSSLEHARVFEPSAVVLSGGYCEPTLLSHPECGDLDGLVQRLRRLWPLARFGINTNGSRDAGGCVSHLDWLRINLDAATEDSFRRLKRPPTSCTFESVLDLGRRYLQRSDGPSRLLSLAFGFLYMDTNLTEAPVLVERVFEHLSDLDRFEIVNIQFRPLRPPMPVRRQAEAVGSFEPGCSPDQIAALHDRMQPLLQAEDPRLRRFVTAQTNLVEVFTRYRSGSASFGYPTFPALCSVPLLSVLVGPDGSLYPCLESREVGSFDPGSRMVIGRLQDLDSRWGRVAVALNSYLAANRIQAHCNRIDCSQGEVILPVDRALDDPGACKKRSESPFF